MNNTETNRPEGSYSYGFLFVFKLVNSPVIQIYIPFNDNADQEQRHRICVRQYMIYNSSWTPWDTYLPAKNV